MTLVTLVCPRCLGPLAERSGALHCAACRADHPLHDGIADFSGGAYYDTFAGPETLTAENLRGLANESEGARIEDYYLPLLAKLRPAGAPPLRVLDSGCGNGESVDLLDAAGLDAWGHDLSALRKWQWGSRRRKDRLVVADGAALPFPTGGFDAVISSGVLEHIGVAETGGVSYTVTPLPDRDARRAAFLAGLLRVVAPGGRLFLDFPNGAFPIDFWHGTRPGGARVHSPREGFLPSVREVARLVRAIDPSVTVRAISPRGRLRFRQVGAHWYGRVFRAPMAAFYAATSWPGLGFLSGTALNPYLVLEVGSPGTELEFAL